MEGKRDVRALRNLGFTGVIIPFNRGQSTVHFAETVARDNSIVILLPDWDRTGKKLLKEWRRQFRALGIKVIDDHWSKLLVTLKKEITSVEELDSLVFRLRSEVENRGIVRMKRCAGRKS